jgi:hypothetical protein
VNSRFALLREFAGKGLICFGLFAAKPRLARENQRNSRLNGKNRELSKVEGAASRSGKHLAQDPSRRPEPKR